MNANNDRPMQAAVAVVIEESRFLTIKRSKTVRAPGEYCFPGGGIEAGETIEAAIIREMQEELGVVVRPLKPIWTSFTPTGVELFWWSAEILDGQQITPNLTEVESFHWLQLAEIRELPELLASNVAFFQSLERGEFQLFE